MTETIGRKKLSALAGIIKSSLPSADEMKTRWELRKKNAELNPNCFTHWYPTAKHYALTPESLIVPVSPDMQMELTDKGPAGGGNELTRLVEIIKEFGRLVGFPLFLKNSLFSAKHSWSNSCFIENEDVDIADHIATICCDWVMVGGDVALYFIVRAMIPTEAAFTAFTEMPITPEFRVFARKGTPECWQPYWPAEAILNPSCDDWRARLAAISTPTSDELTEMHRIAGQISLALDEYYSLDFLRDKSGKLWLIDMARGENSYLSPHKVEF